MVISNDQSKAIKLKYNQHRASTQACSFHRPVNFLFTHFSHLSWINSSGLFSTTGSNDNYTLIHTWWLANSNKGIPASQAHECRLKTSRNQFSSLPPLPCEEMWWGCASAMDRYNLWAVLPGILFQLLKCLVLFSPLLQLFHQNPRKEGIPGN